MFRQVTRVRLKEQVAESFLNMILSGEYKPGDRFPTERTLVGELGVSRTVVREALNLLETRGVVRIEHGKGVWVNEDSGRALHDAFGLLFRIDPESLWDLLEMRKVLEIEVAGFAAERASAEDTDAMQATLDRMRDRIDAPEGYVEADLEFHNLVARSSRNKVLMRMIESNTGLLLASRELTGARPSNARRALRAHEAILERVRGRDAVGARREMAGHLEVTEQDIKAALKAQEEG